MSNWFENNPTRSVLTTFITAFAFSWGVFQFVVYDSTINNYESAINNKEANLKRIESNSDILLARINQLEKEKDKLEKIVAYYFEWISKSENSIPALQKRIEDLIAEESTNIEFSIPKNESIGKNQEYSKVTTIYEDNAYIDKVTGIVVGVTEITINNDVDIHITLPEPNKQGQVSIKETIKTGYVLEYNVGDRTYRLVCIDADFIMDYTKFSIQEIKRY